MSKSKNIDVWMLQAVTNKLVEIKEERNLERFEDLKINIYEANWLVELVLDLDTDNNIYGIKIHSVTEID